MRYYIWMFLTTVCLSCINEGMDCTQFKNGEFRYLRASASDVRIVRNDSLHIEISKKKKYKDTYKIVWLDECSYYLVIDKTTNDSLMPLQKTDTLFTEIIEVSDSSYKYLSTFNGSAREGELIKVD